MDMCKSDTTVPTTQEEVAKEAEQQEEKSPGCVFDGTWVLTKNVGSDDYLKTEGVGMIKRNAFKVLNVTMEVAVKDGRCQMTVKGTFGSAKEYDAPTDGKEYVCENLQGEEQTRTYKLAEDGKTLTVTSKPTPSGGTDTRVWEIKEIDGKTQLVVKVTNDKGGEMTQLFSRKE